MEVFLQGVGVLGPGLLNWPNAITVLKEQETYSSARIPEPIPTLLPPNEFRRSSDVVRWSLQVAQEALTQTELLPKEVCTVFASSEGESQVLQDIFLSLAQEKPLLSPTLFHHSGHNAAAGYWSIATQSQQASTSLSCYDASFTSGLLELSVQVRSMKSSGLLVACDIPPPAPLLAARKLTAPFAVALLVSDHRTPYTQANLHVTMSKDSNVKSSLMSQMELESLRQGNPAARALPLLAMIASGQQGRVSLPYLNNQNVQVDVTTMA